MNHFLVFWQSPPLSTHLTPQTTKDGSVIFIMRINSDSRLRLEAISMAADQMRAHYDKSDTLVSVVRLTVSMETIAVPIRCMCLRKLPSQSGWNIIRQVELVSRDLTQLSKRYTASSYWACVFKRQKEALFPSRVSHTHTHIVVLFHSKCVSHGSHR